MFAGCGRSLNVSRVMQKLVFRSWLLSYLKKKLGWHLPSQDLFWYITDYKIELSYLQRLYLGGFHVTGQVTGQTIPINNVDRDVMIIFFRALCCSERF